MTPGLCMNGYRNKKTGSSRNMRSSSNSVSPGKFTFEGFTEPFDALWLHETIFVTSNRIVLIIQPPEGRLVEKRQSSAF